MRRRKKELKQGFLSVLRKIEGLEVGDLLKRERPSLKGTRVDKISLCAIDDDLTKRQVGGRLTSRQRVLRSRLIKLCGSSSTRRLRLFLQTKLDLLRVKVTQQRSLRAKRRRKALKARYRRERVGILRKGGRSGWQGPIPTKSEISE